MKPGQRRKILEEWRVLPEDNRGQAPKSMERLMQRTMRELGLQDRLMEDGMVEAWTEIVGEYHARLSRPVELKKGWLVVAVMQPAVKYDLERFHKDEILRRMQEKFGKNTIRGVRFRAGS